MKPIINFNSITTKEKLSLILVILVITFTFWNRIIRERLPKDLSDFNNPFAMTFLIITIISLVIIILTIIITNLSQKTPRVNPVIDYINKSHIKIYFYQISHHITKGHKIIFDYLYKKMNFAKLLEKPSHKASQIIKTMWMKNALIITILNLLFNALPKTIPAIVFITEILVNHKLAYFYKSLLILIIPIIYNSLLWILANLADNNTIFATAHVDFFHYNPSEFDASFKKIVPSIDNAIDIVSRKLDKELLEWFVYLYETYADIKWLIYRLELEKNVIKYYESILLSSLYLIGWLYILVKNFSLVYS